MDKNSYSIKGEFESFPLFKTSLQRGIMPVIGIFENEIRSYGTCFCITSFGLMVTAKHVIEDAMSDFDYNPKQGMSGEINLNAKLGVLFAKEVKSLDEEFESEVILIHQIYFNKGSDIAIFTTKCERPDGSIPKFSGTKLTVDLPKEKENILGMGYYSMVWKGSFLNQKYIHGIEYSFQSAFSRGIVQEVHIRYRDKILLNFPVFRTTARFESGMSGGPVVKENGAICGVICSSFDTEENEHVSYVSLLWPLMGQKLSIYLENREKGAQTLSILDLCNLGLVLSENLTHEALIDDKDPDTINFSEKIIKS